jgi:hypothetical protein
MAPKSSRRYHRDCPRHWRLELDGLGKSCTVTLVRGLKSAIEETWRKSFDLVEDKRVGQTDALSTKVTE